MAKHRKQSTGTTRRMATTAAVAATASVAVPTTAQATEVVIPNTGFSINVDGIENIPGIKNVPNIGAYVPSLAGQVAPQSIAEYASNIVAPPAPPAPSKGELVLAAARSAMGAPYVWGAAGPSAFDCSGLTSWAYAQAGISIPRTSYAQAAQGQRVSMADIQPGDIVVYYGGASHVGIYAGNGMIIDALNAGAPVGQRSVNYMPIHSIVRY
ncbi:endopeptidase [Corynebacterium phocae]|uniref:Endopeptidase n=1 Tax=Corynebacterium phocae TaxID=161895 RepID=A0A1L7D682_9CORY|nr:C40 family peptidase [Corynebacterium phocae]APT93654.1 endopeptidase [Corynebacterium phocae]KAA8725787.1 NlpC/P60 family protein [Corynebacterium phocae]